MSKLLMLEFKKLNRTFLYILIPVTFILPLILVLVQYATDSQHTLSDIIVNSSIFIQMISFSCVVISGCYIVAREYSSNMASYLAITPNSMKNIILCKLAVLFIETFVLQLAIFSALFSINTVLYGFDKVFLIHCIFAGVLSSILFGCLIPFITCIALWRRSFSGSAIIFLILFMLTFPFTFMSYGFIFPHLLPVILVSKYLGNDRYIHLSYLPCILILIGFMALSLRLSIIRAEMKE